MKKIGAKVVQRIKKYIVNKQYLRLLPKPQVEVLASDWPEFHNRGAGKKILYLAAKYDYADKSRGIGYEEYNFFYTLKNMQGIEVIRLDVYSMYQRYGKEVTNKVIKEVALLEGVDSVLLLLYLDVFDHKMFKDLSDNYSLETIIWLFDDDKRYLETEALVKCFNKVVTTIDVRHKARLANGLNSKLAQFAANHYLYKDYGMRKEYDVVFVGQNFGNRQEYIEHLQNNGIAVKAFGRGWHGTGRLSQVEMIELLNKAKISLNFSSSDGNPKLKFLKGRVFEIPATGSMLLTEECENLDDYFDIGKHVDVFKDKDELLDKVNHYLNQQDLLNSVSIAGKALILEKYTFEQYLFGVLLKNYVNNNKKNSQTNSKSSI